MKTYEERICRIESQIHIMGNRMEELYKERQELMKHLIVRMARQQKERKAALMAARADVRKSRDGFIIKIVTEPDEALADVI